ncbi:MAG: peptidoglycan-binding domain-containing protein [Candidatus Omnitrophica bacterium]|nr:peptidoglycan-binding domain-containing protein [Candidatus Omnitrophota bacterium]
MVMRFVIVFILMTALTGCLKKNSDESLSMEPAVTEETSVAAMENISQSVSVEPAVTQMAEVEKPSVQDIQQALKNSNFYEGNIDGISGPKTRKAIEAFQSKIGLKADGKVGPKTWQKLKEYLNKKAQ